MTKSHDGTSIIFQAQTKTTAATNNNCKYRSIYLIYRSLYNFKTQLIKGCVFKNKSFRRQKIINSGPQNKFGVDSSEFPFFLIK